MKNIKEARKEALLNKAQSIRTGELMQAFFYISNSADIRRMADVLEVEDKAQKIKRGG